MAPGHTRNTHPTTGRITGRDRATSQVEFSPLVSCSEPATRSGAGPRAETGGAAACNWGNRNLIANRPVNINNIGNNWQHRPEHRHGVRYNNANVAQKFAGNNNLRSSAGQRQDFRGKDGNRPGGDRAGLGDRDRPGGDRAGVGDRDRPGGGDRGKVGNRDRAGAGSAKGDRGGQRDAARPRVRVRKSAGAKGSGKAGQSRGGQPSERRRQARRRGRRPRRDAAFNMQSGRVASAQSMRGHASLGGGGGRSFAGGGGGFRGGSVGMGGGGFRGGGGGGFAAAEAVGAAADAPTSRSSTT